MLFYMTVHMKGGAAATVIVGILSLPKDIKKKKKEKRTAQKKKKPPTKRGTCIRAVPVRPCL
jgi:hypothetical protein